MASKKKPDIQEEEVKAVVTEAEEPKKKKAEEDDGKVMVMVPYIEGEDPEVTVIVNYKVTKFKKGVPVRVNKTVAEVLQNSFKQTMLQVKNQDKFKNMGMDL